MRAGPLTYRLELLRPERSVDSFGAERTVYTPVRTVRAERVRMSPSARLEAGESFADYRVEFNIRMAHPVAENWRVRQLGGHLYTVTNIVPNHGRGFKTLICERVNE